MAVTCDDQATVGDTALLLFEVSGEAFPALDAAVTESPGIASSAAGARLGRGLRTSSGRR